MRPVKPERLLGIAAFEPVVVADRGMFLCFDVPWGDVTALATEHGYSIETIFAARAPGVRTLNWHRLDIVRPS